MTPDVLADAARIAEDAYMDTSRQVGVTPKTDWVAVVLAIEPLIRADERRLVMVHDLSMADLRAKVEALRNRPIASFDGYTGKDALDQVLALIDGSGG